MYLLIKYIKSVLQRERAKRLSYIEDARCLKVNLSFLEQGSNVPRYFSVSKEITRNLSPLFQNCTGSNMRVLLFAFHALKQQPFKPLWSFLFLCDHEMFEASVLQSLQMSLLPARGICIGFPFSEAPLFFQLLTS